MNPFKYGCVVAGENYCRRPELQRQLSELVKSGQNVVVQGPRRMGKTSLVVETVKSLRGVTLLYVDLFSVRSVGEFCRKVVSATAKCGKRTFLERTAELVKGLRPVFSVDRDTGAPTISVDVKAARSVESVEEVMDMIAGHSAAKRLCVVFDEFQDVLDIPDSVAVRVAPEYDGDFVRRHGVKLDLHGNHPRVAPRSVEHAVGHDLAVVVFRRRHGRHDERCGKKCGCKSHGKSSFKISYRHRRRQSTATAGRMKEVGW